jgi:hypothetical protein
MLDQGTYRGRPVRAALGMTGTGKEQIGVLFEFVEPVGHRMTWYGFFTDDTWDRTIEALRACGWRGDDLTDFVEGQQLPAGFDQEVELVVKHEVYQGKTTARIAFVNSGGGLAMKETLTQDQAKAFAARMQRRIATLGGTPRREPAKGTKPAPARTAPLADDGPPIEHLDERAREELGGKADVPY